MLELETLITLVNAFLCEYATSKLSKPYLKVFLRKSLNFRTKVEIFWTFIIFKMSWLATRIIFELTGVGAAPDLSKPQAFKNVSLQLIIDQTFTFRRIFFERLHHIQLLAFDTKGQIGRGTFLPLPVSASTSLFQNFYFSGDVFLSIDHNQTSNKINC